MTENKLDRRNLKRQAQRVESYSVLVSKRSAIFKNDQNIIGMHLGKSSTGRCQKLEHFNINSYEEGNRKKYYNEQHPSSSISENASSSSDSSQEFHQDLYNNWRSAQNPNQYEEDATPVMTRSATRKYASVGAIYNKVDLEQELMITRKWPVSVCRPPPNILKDNLQLRDVVTRSLDCVMSFCMYSNLQVTKPLCKENKSNVNFDLEKSVNVIDLSPYLSQEFMTENDDHRTQITLHLNESILSHQFINVISINNEEQSQDLVIQEDNNELETITLHSGETYVLDSKYISNSNSDIFINLSETRAGTIQSIHSEDPMIAVYNDHTYAMRYDENISFAESQLNEPQASPKQKESELIFQNALKDLLLNTAILKCLICGQTPQEMIDILDKAHHKN